MSSWRELATDRILGIVIPAKAGISFELSSWSEAIGSIAENGRIYYESELGI